MVLDEILRPHQLFLWTFLDSDEFKKLCRPGAGADTCIWAMVGDKGPECGYYNRHPELVRRWEAGETVAKRDGCDVVRALRRSIDVWAS